MGGSFIHAVLLASVKYIAEGFTLEKAIKTVSCPTVECIDVLSIVSIYGTLRTCCVSKIYARWETRV